MRRFVSTLGELLLGPRSATRLARRATSSFACSIASASPDEVIAPSLIPVAPGAKVKTDKRDARRLAHLYRAGELVAVHIPTPQEEAIRDLARTRPIS